MASEVYAAAQAEAARIAAEAYADGEIDAEEARAIADATAKMNEAKSYALAQAAAAESAAKSYAEAQAAAAQAAAEAVAEAEAESAEISAKAYADGVVSAEEQRAIAEAAAKLTEAKNYAESQAAAAESAAKAYADTQLGNFATTVTGSLSDLQNQIDGSITTHFYAYVPTTSNAPASGWTTTAMKNQHLGDLFYNTATGFCYRYQLVSSVYSWQRITDSDVTKALADAAEAKDTADSKRRVFVATPTTPYDIGDLWLKSGDLYKCKVTRATGSYVASDWEKGVKYTDDTVANQNLILAQQYADTKKAEAIAAAEAVAEAEALAAQTAAEAHADGIVTAEEQARIADVNAKLATAKTYAETKATEAKNAAEAAAAADATAKANAAKSAAETYALAKANLAETNAKAHADGIVDAEEARAIADATAKANAAKAAAEATAAALDDAIQVGGRNYFSLSKHSASVDNKVYIQVEPNTDYIVWSNVPGYETGVGATIYFNGGSSPVNGVWKGHSVIINSGSQTEMYVIFIPERLYGAEILNGTYFIMWEKGNKATDWTPAPEDVQAEIDAAEAAAVTTAASDATSKMNAAKDAIAQEAGYTNFADMASKAALTVNGLLNSQIINVDDLFANTAFISKLLLEAGFINYLTVKFLETVGDANGYKVQIKNSLNSEGTGESYVRLVNSDGTRKAELVFDANNVYGGSGGLPVLRITDNGCYSRVFAEGLEAVSTTSGRFSYNMLSQFTPFGMTFATGTHASAAVKGGFTWDRNNGKVLIYVNTLPRGGFGTVSEGFLYRSPDGLSNDVIRYQS
jgi:hypothetical protein